MTLRLILTRHAKSDWDDPLLDDHDRPLNARGRASAPAMGQWLRDRNAVPGQALVSTATRAVETWEGMAPALPATVVSFHPGLYHAAPDTILAHIARADAPTLLVIGHNPGFAMLASALVKRPPDHGQFGLFPTCATLVVEFDVADWALVLPGSGIATAFAVPRDLMGGKA